MELLLLAVLGGALALDTTAVGQFMVSRPLVAGAITGWILGVPELGIGVGAVLELYLLVSFPTGGARFPEAATATVVAVGCASTVAGPGALPLSVAAGLLWGQIGGATVVGQRKLNARIAPMPEEGSGAVRRLGWAHPAAIGLDWVRGAAVTVSGLVIGRWGIGLIVDRWPLDEIDSIGLVLVGGLVSAGVLLHDIGGFRRHRIWFVAGLALGIVGMRFL